MSIRLADLTDAELGALVRRSMGAQALVDQIEKQKKRDEQDDKDTRARNERFLREREERRAMQPLPTPPGLPYLNMTEAEWNEVAPTTVIETYIKASREAGTPWYLGEDATWAQLAEVHMSLTTAGRDVDDLNAAIHQESDTAVRLNHKVEALMSIAKISKAEALERVLALETTTTEGTA